MGTEVQFNSNILGYRSMRDLNEEPNDCSYPIFYGDKALQYGHCQNGLLPRAAADYLGYDKDIVKQRMLEHEATFRSQVYELHRLYGIQRVLMDELKWKEPHRSRVPDEASFPSSSLMSQNNCEGARKWQIASAPLASSNHAIPSTSEAIHSPVSSVKMDPIFPSQNGESRPTKVRRKMFDLHLPAHEYIDEHDPNNNDSSQCTFGNFQDKDRKAETGNGLNLLFGKTEICLGGRNITDLNEPVPVEDVNPLPGMDSAKPKQSFLGLPRESFIHSHCESNGEIANSFSSVRDAKGSGWLSHALEPGYSKGKKSISQGQRSDNYMPQQQMSCLLNKNHRIPSSLQTDKKLGLTRDGAFCDFGISESLKSPESVLVSQFPTQFLIAPSADSSKSSWPQSMLYWEKPIRIHQLEASESYGMFSGKQQDKNAIPFNEQNGFYYGSSSGPRELSGSNNHYPSLGFGYINKILSNGEVNLNVVPEIASGEGKQKENDDLHTLPWLRAKAVVESEVTATNDLNSRETKVFDSKRLEVGESPTFYVSRNKPSSLNSLRHRSEDKVMETERKVKLFDMNLPCDETVESSKDENSGDTKSTCQRHLMFDLNSCLSEEDEFSSLVQSTNRKLVSFIDLEVPAVPENEEDGDGFFPGGQALEKTGEMSKQCSERKCEEATDELGKVAAEAIVAISSARLEEYSSDVDLEETKEDTLIWFVDTILSRGGTARRGGNDKEEVDFFELMTLQLSETKPEDYLPDPFVLAISDDMDESAAAMSAPGRPRRGAARRGRQRRDFQRDILPGLTSLSRHEVSEDIQTFGGMMRATGHSSWQPGLTRRKAGPARGRRRKLPVANISISPSSGSGSPGQNPSPMIQKVNNSIEIPGFEDMKSLSGWGKTTRRPRRQRCPAGNSHPIIQLT